MFTVTVTVVLSQYLTPPQVSLKPPFHWLLGARVTCMYYLALQHRRFSLKIIHTSLHKGFYLCMSKISLSTSIIFSKRKKAIKKLYTKTIKESEDLSCNA